MPRERIPYKQGTGCLVMLTLFALGCAASGVVAYEHKPGWAIGAAWAPFVVLMIIAVFRMPRGR